jgi:DNA-binding CsgD family transcriptional regulator
MHHLALLLPEIGPPSGGVDRQSILESVRAAFETLSLSRPIVVVLDDLQWSDEATLDMLGALAPALSDMACLILGAYRSDEIPRGHPMRRLRDELRRSNSLREIGLVPFDEIECEAHVTQVLGRPPSASLARTIHDRTQGNPFFVEELCAALLTSNTLTQGPTGWELAGDGEIPVPATIRDAVVMRTSDLTMQAREAAEVAAVAGERFELAAVATLVSEAGLTELQDRELLVEVESGRGVAKFRQGLVREALYAEIPWLRRQALHRDLARLVDRPGVPRGLVALHYREAGELSAARFALLGAVEESLAVHAYRDAAKAGRDALDLWPDDQDPEGRLDALERYGLTSELAGDLAEAARAWKEAASIRAESSASRALADAQRRLADVYRLQGDRSRALAARMAAAQAYDAVGLAGEASADHIVAALHLQAGGQHQRALEIVSLAIDEAQRAARLDLRARALGVQGAALAKRGDFEDGLAAVRAGLSLAVEHDFVADAAEIYQRLANVLQTSADYGAAREALQSALNLCDMPEAASRAQDCLACMAYILRELGEWDEAERVARRLSEDEQSSDDTRVVAEGILGSIQAFRGHAAGQAMLASAYDSSLRLDELSMQLDTAATLAWLSDYNGDSMSALDYSRQLLRRWRQSEDRHYAVWGLRQASTLFAIGKCAAEANECAGALTEIGSHTGHPDALAALAHALGEAAMLEGSHEAAAQQFLRAIELHRELEMPFELAQVRLRTGTALVLAGERELGLEQFANSYRAARKLGARPLATRAAGEVAKLGESVERRLGRRAAADHEGHGLSRRELEVLRLAALGHTNREIAAELFLSPRTVDMHIRNTLTKLGCRSRVQAARRAQDLGILDS